MCARYQNCSTTSNSTASNSTGSSNTTDPGTGSSGSSGSSGSTDALPSAAATMDLIALTQTLVEVVSSGTMAEVRSRERDQGYGG
jgi:hypothetical protein